MVYVVDSKKNNEYTDFSFNAVAKDKRAEWHSKEDAYYGISCFIKDNHSDDKNYSINRYKIVED
jgi:hypothetical protein